MIKTTYCELDQEIQTFKTAIFPYC
uniref:Uncharacterized protein n=1 Tax=Anguilla anguilla TaxID=7936 RepID=A0A0E9PXX7_ANGAN